MSTYNSICEGADIIQASRAFVKLASSLPSLKGHRVPLMQVYFGGADYQYFLWGNFVLSHGQRFRIYLGPFSRETDGTLKAGKNGGEHGPWCLYEDGEEGRGEGRRCVEQISVILRRNQFNPHY